MYSSGLFEGVEEEGLSFLPPSRESQGWFSSVEMEASRLFLEDLPIRLRRRWIGAGELDVAIRRPL